MFHTKSDKNAKSGPSSSSRSKRSTFRNKSSRNKLISRRRKDKKFGNNRKSRLLWTSTCKCKSRFKLKIKRREKLR